MFYCWLTCIQRLNLISKFDLLYLFRLTGVKKALSAKFKMNLKHSAVFNSIKHLNLNLLQLYFLNYTNLRELLNYTQRNGASPGPIIYIKWHKILVELRSRALKHLNWIKFTFLLILFPSQTQATWGYL